MNHRRTAFRGVLLGAETRQHPGGQMRITYYLFGKTVTSFSQVWRASGKPPTDYRQVTLRPTVPFEAEAYLLPNRPTVPDWWAFVEPHCEVSEDSRPSNRASSFVLLLKVDDRIFAATFGHGFTAINRDLLEPDFGLKVTLNAVNPARLRSVQARNVDPTTVSKQLVVNQDSKLSAFDVDFYQDLLAKMEGVPGEAIFGKRVAGADACYQTADTSLPELATQCEQLLKYYGSRRYARTFSFVDQVRPVREDDVVAALDSEFGAALAAGETAGLGLALPDIAGYDRIETYRATRGRWGRAFEELDPRQILEVYNQDHPGADDQARLKIIALDGNGDPVCDFTLRQCAVFEVVWKKQRYVLTLNKWYRVNAEYAARVDAHVARLPVIKSPAFLPKIRAGTSEGAYNEAAAKAKKMALMDKQNVRPAAPTSAIEVCDLFSKNREFIHVKRHTRSATLSHLLAQGTVSARLFVDDQGYRKTFRAALPPAFRRLVVPERIDPGRHTVVYAITAPPTMQIPNGLPFFTKVNLLFHCREIQRMGMVAKIHHIHEIANATPGG